MKLNVKYKKKQTKTTKQKKKEDEKKQKGPKLSKNYKDESEFICYKESIDMTKMRYGMIDSCNVIAVELNDGIINLNNSWIELILIMLSMVIETKGEKALQILAENEVTNQNFCVDKVYGKYTFDSNQYKAYKIFDTGYYLEAIFTNESIFSAIYGLLKCINIPLDEINFVLINKKNKEEKLNFNNLKDIEYIVKSDEVAFNIKSGIHLIEIKIEKEVTVVRRLDVALVAICNYIYDNTSEEEIVAKLDKLKHGNTGIDKTSDCKNKQNVRLKQSNLAIYTDNNTESIVEFIQKIEEEFKLDIQFKFRALKDKNELKKYEVD